MGYAERQAYCYRCRQPTLHASQWSDIPHTAYLLFALIFGLLTCGIGAVLVLLVWGGHLLIDGLSKPPPFRCRRCGTPLGMGNR
jgi:hypothetical protein